MKRKRILSLLLVLTVMATMLMAVPLTGYAENTIVVYSLTSTYSGEYEYSSLTGGTDSTAYTDTINGLTGYGKFNNATSSASYTYTDTSNESHSYSFTNAWQAGVGSTTKRCLYFTPESPCTVTAVFFGSEAQRSMTIYQSSSVTATTEGSNAVGTVQLEITDTSLPVYVYGGSNNKYLYAIIVDYGDTSGSPKVTLNQSSIKCATGVETQLTASTANLGEDDTYTVGWESDNEDIATVSESGLVTAVAEGDATITASLYVNGSETASSTATCVVTVSDNAEVAVTIPNTMKNITLTYSGEGDAPGGPYVVEPTTAASYTETISVAPGTYTVSGEIGAPLTHGFTLSADTLEVAAAGSYTVTGTSSNIASSLETDYSELYDTTVKFDMANSTPASSRYINLEGVATADLATDTDGVYLTVDTTTKTDETLPVTPTTDYISNYKGKFASATQGSGQAQVRRYVTWIYVPVVPGSVVTVSSQSSLFDCASENVTESDGQVFTYTGDEETTIMLYVNSNSVTNASDDWLYSITIDPPPSYTFGDFETDAGYYYNTAGDQTLGVIRFLQAFEGDTPDSYGFYFVDENGDIKSYVSGEDSSDASLSSSEGFYGDLVDIDKSEDGNNFYALPFVTYGSRTCIGDFDADTHYGTANFSDELSYNSYSDWNVGQASSTSTDGAISVVEKEGKTALSIDVRNAYYTLNSAVSEGTVTFTTDVYIDTTSNENLFRIYLENSEASNYQSSTGVMAQVLNARGGVFRYGPTVVNSDGYDNGTEGYTYYNVDESGWYTITITVDYDVEPSVEGFITVNVVNPSGTEVLNQAMASVLTSDGADNALNQIRLIKISETPYFANMKITTTD